MRSLVSMPPSTPVHTISSVYRRKAAGRLSSITCPVFATRPEAELPELAPEELLFPQENGQLMSSKTYERHWSHYCKDAGFVTYTPIQRTDKRGKPYVYQKPTITLTAHQLRHGYATILYEAGIDAQTAKVLLGHSDIAVTLQIYTHIRNKKRASVTDILNAAFSGQKPGEKEDAQ